MLQFPSTRCTAYGWPFVLRITGPALLTYSPCECEHICACIDQVIGPAYRNRLEVNERQERARKTKANNKARRHPRHQREQQQQTASSSTHTVGEDSGSVPSQSQSTHTLRHNKSARDGGISKASRSHPLRRLPAHGRPAVPRKELGRAPPGDGGMLLFPRIDSRHGSGQKQRKPSRGLTPETYVRGQ